MQPETLAADVAAQSPPDLAAAAAEKTAFTALREDTLTASATDQPRTAHKDPRLPALPRCLDEAAWFDNLSHIAPAQARTLAAALRTLYPHDAIGEPVYRRVVVAFDLLAVKSPVVRQWLRAFVEAIDSALPLAFAALSESYRVGVLKGIEATPAFRFVQRAGVRYFYDDVEVWEAFGYEGASYHLGGYVDRGFDDLDWLPGPGAAASAQASAGRA